ncbi:unnamed protein product [Candida verbasci]|uniref:Probable electron transfer flavoprotein subunit alpha n=1 Tax=Candida verbasci TaxID=1227364 RepID=A0A9W4TSK0_9ASCO|nr:unnamed protein product [Candida verbasci]
MLAFRRLFSTSRIRLDTLILIENVNNKISPNSLSTITAAQQIGEPINAIIIGDQSENLSKQVAEIKGINKVLIAKDSKYNHYLAEEVSPLLKSVIEENKFNHFLISGSSVGKSILPRLGALLNVQPISEIIKVIDPKTFVRPIYAGNALATVKSKDDIILASVRASAFPQTEEKQDAVKIQDLNKDIESGNYNEFVTEQLSSSERPELGSAKIVVAGGRGLKNKEMFDNLLEPLANKLNAAIGASRAAVDSGFCDNSLQVGQTGKIVAPDLYFAIGISGAIQHLAGMKDSKVIVAINKDGEAPIFNIADIGLVGDLNEILPELLDKVK